MSRIIHCDFQPIFLIDITFFFFSKWNVSQCEREKGMDRSPKYEWKSMISGLNDLAIKWFYLVGNYSTTCKYHGSWPFDKPTPHDYSLRNERSQQKHDLTPFCSLTLKWSIFGATSAIARSSNEASKRGILREILFWYQMDIFRILYMIDVAIWTAFKKHMGKNAIRVTLKLQN